MSVDSRQRATRSVWKVDQRRNLTSGDEGVAVGECLDMDATFGVPGELPQVVQDIHRSDVGFDRFTSEGDDVGRDD